MTGHADSLAASEEPLAAPEPGAPVDVSFVAIGYNEARTLGPCLESLRRAAPAGSACEFIYVDAGSRDASLEVAQAAGLDRILGGERRRRASENRNLGLQVARGEFVQFVDGDMVLAPDWAQAARDFLGGHPDVAAVCGNLVEAGQGLLFRVLEIDWMPREGPIRHCGGAAMYRREALDRLGGFPEDLPYGEEPYLCWRIRNELGMKIYQLNRTMADHDLGFRGWRDYWRRSVRCGATYAEIANRCRRSADRLWFREAVTNAAWAVALVAGVAALVLGPWPLRAAVLAAGLAVVARKTFQTARRGYSVGVALLYALHSYLAKLPIAWGECRWAFQRLFRSGPRPAA